MWHDSFMIHACNVTYAWVLHVTWLIHTSSVWRDSFINHVRDMTHPRFVDVPWFIPSSMIQIMYVTWSVVIHSRIRDSWFTYAAAFVRSWVIHPRTTWHESQMREWITKLRVACCDSCRDSLLHEPFVLLLRVLFMNESRHMWRSESRHVHERIAARDDTSCDCNYIHTWL